MNKYYESMLLYFIFIFMYVSNFFSYMLLFQDNKNLLIAIRFICFALSFLILLKSNVLIKKKFISKILLFLFICLLYLLITKNLFYFDVMSVVIFALFLSFFDWKSKKLNLFFLSCILLTLFVLVSLLALNGLIESKSFMMASSYGFSIKHSLGFLNPNIISMLILSITVLIYVYDQRALFFISTLIFLAFSVWLGSRTYMLASVLSIVLIPFVGMLHRFKFLIFLYLLIPLILYGLLYSQSFKLVTDLLNYALSGRLTLITEYINATSFIGLLFGGVTFEKVDMAFFNLIFSFGILGYMLFMMLVLNTFKKATEKELYMLFVILFVMMFENVISFNCILMAVFLSDIFNKYGVKVSKSNV